MQLLSKTTTKLFSKLTRFEITQTRIIQQTTLVITHPSYLHTRSKKKCKYTKYPVHTNYRCNQHTTLHHSTRIRYTRNLLRLQKQKASIKIYATTRREPQRVRPPQSMQIYILDEYSKPCGIVDSRQRYRITLLNPVRYSTRNSRYEIIIPAMLFMFAYRFLEFELQTYTHSGRLFIFLLKTLTGLVVVASFW